MKNSVIMLILVVVSVFAFAETTAPPDPAYEVAFHETMVTSTVITELNDTPRIDGWFHTGELKGKTVVRRMLAVYTPKSDKLKDNDAVRQNQNFERKLATLTF